MFEQQQQQQQHGFVASTNGDGTEAEGEGEKNVFENIQPQIRQASIKSFRFQPNVTQKVTNHVNYKSARSLACSTKDNIS